MSAAFSAMHSFLVGSTENKVEFQKTGAFSVVLDVVQSEKDVKYLTHALQCLAGLLATNVMKETFGNANGIEIALKILDEFKDSDDIVHRCMVILRNGASGKMKDQIREKNGIEKVIASLRAFPKHYAVQHEGLMMLHNMITSGGKAREKIVELGIFEIIETGMENHPNSEGCVRCLRQLMVDILPQDEGKLIKCNYVKHVLKTLEDEALQSYCFEIISVLATFYEVHYQFLEAKGIEELLSYLPEAGAKVWSPVYSLIDQSDDLAKDFLDNEGLDVAIEAIDSDDIVQKYMAFSIIANLVQNDYVGPRAKAELATHEILSLITQITQTLTPQDIHELQSVMKKYSQTRAIHRMLYAHRERIGKIVQSYAPQCAKLFDIAYREGAQFEFMKAMQYHRAEGRRFVGPKSYAGVSNNRLTFDIPTPLILWNDKIVSFDASYLYLIDPESLKVVQKIEPDPEISFAYMAMSAAVVWKDALFTASYTGHLYKWMPNEQKVVCVLGEEAYISTLVVWNDKLVTMGNSYDVRMWDFDLKRVGNQGESSEHHMPCRSWCGTLVTKEVTQDIKKAKGAKKKIREETSKESNETKEMYLAIGGSDKQVHIYDYQEEKLVQVDVWQNHASKYPIYSVVEVPGAGVAFGNSVGHMLQFLPTKYSPVDIEAHKAPIKRLTVWPKKDILISCGDCWDITLWKGEEKLSTIDSYDMHMNSVVIFNERLYYQDAFGCIHKVEISEDGKKIVSNFKRPVVTLDEIPTVIYTILGPIPENVNDEEYDAAQEDSDSDLSAQGGGDDEEEGEEGENEQGEGGGGGEEEGVEKGEGEGEEGEEEEEEREEKEGGEIKRRKVLKAKRSQ
eukprot:Phypoly_transcript_02234.p1 GENE.Phypoly_transcript_02234~~Phypoly_transcript_02234.p1  ORF type:complete len:964 (+),score=200.16 Phypoly_transcript_02234:349-2892(+)